MNDDKNEKVEELKDAVEDIEGKDNTDIPSEFSEVLEDMPEDVRKQVEQIMVSSVQMAGIIRPENNISKKITEQHITDYLDASKQQMLEDYKSKREDKIFQGIVLFVVLAFIIIVIILLKDIPDVMEKIVYILVGGFGGYLGGYGYGKSKKHDD